MAVMEMVVKGGLTLGAAVVGFFLLPILVGAVTGVLAALLEMTIGNVPAPLSVVGTSPAFGPLFAVGGAVLAAGWVVQR